MDTPSRPDVVWPVYVGVAIVATGFALLGVTWAIVADETAVADQLPPIVLGGGLGLAAIVVGLTVVAVQSRHRDAIAESALLDAIFGAARERAAAAEEES